MFGYLLKYKLLMTSSEKLGNTWPLRVLVVYSAEYNTKLVDVGLEHVMILSTLKRKVNVNMTHATLY